MRVSQEAILPAWYRFSVQDRPSSASLCSAPSPRGRLINDYLCIVWMNIRMGYSYVTKIAGGSMKIQQVLLTYYPKMHLVPGFGATCT
jgi:hypothetical protein